MNIYFYTICSLRCFCTSRFQFAVVCDVDRSQRRVDHRRSDASRVVGRRARRRLEAILLFYK